MYSYLTLSISLVIVSILLFIRLRLKLINPKVLIALSLIMLVMMLIFNTYLTKLPIVIYNSNYISGLKIGTIPIEDFGYLIAVIILLPALYEKFNEK
ncbi:MAG TPA: lycopene cyclase domain-containing protein [Candidatus Saccharibacteria bacterium]|nr:lycopene cyclase domain-containing protein [Candidatus Saccharibacteria bacterium]